MKLQHVALIPDGNRRWARAQGLEPFQGHEKGMKSVAEEILREARRMNIPYVTAWCLSRDNVLKRSVKEIRFLYNLFRENFEKMLDDKELHRDQVRVSVIGEWPRLFPRALKRAIEKIEDATRNYRAYHLTFLMAYDGKREMAHAFQEAQRSNELARASNLKNFLWTKELPPVDLVIRTGGNPHWSSGFMMWHTADSELYFTKTFWPAFTVREFRKAVREYENRPRNLGA